ncbi:MAG: hypothetical protein WAN43_00555 [Rhodomicrobium sp.]
MYSAVPGSSAAMPSAQSPGAVPQLSEVRPDEIRYQAGLGEHGHGNGAGHSRVGNGSRPAAQTPTPELRGPNKAFSPSEGQVNAGEDAERSFNWEDYFSTDELPEVQKTYLEYVPGQEARMVAEALACMRAYGGIYERGPECPEIVHPCAEGMRPMNEAWLRNWLSRHVAYKKWDARNKKHVSCNIPKDVVAQIIAKKVGRELPYLKGVITAPTMRLDGTILDKPGYDSMTELLLVIRKREKSVPVITSPANPAEAYRQAFLTIWRPFKDFPFAEPFDRGVIVAAILTAVTRRVYPTAPGIIIEAAMPGSGKTKAASSLTELTGGVPSILPPTEQEEEMRKRLFSAQRSGEAAILIDNVEGDFGSPSLSAFLTQKMYGDRILGLSEMAKMPTNMLVLVTGNNIQIRGDLWRRVLRCRIDPKTENPDQRDFGGFDPVKHCRENRQEIISAALTLLHGYVRAGRPRMSSITMGSFEEWDADIRQCALWLKDKGYAGDIDLGDPYEAVRQAKAENPQIEVRRTVLECLGNIYPGGTVFMVGDAIASANEADDIANDPLGEHKKRLRDAFHEITAAKNFRSLNDPAARKAIGHWFAQNANFYGGGFVLKKVDRDYKSNKPQQYRVVSTVNH